MKTGTIIFYFSVIFFGAIWGHYLPKNEVKLWKWLCITLAAMLFASFTFGVVIDFFLGEH